MKCERAQAWFSDLIDGSIGSAEKVVLDAHLRDCASCTEEVKRLTSLWHAMDAMPDVPAPSNLRATVWQRIEAQSTQTTAARPVRNPRPIWVRGLALVGAAAAIALLATVTVPGKFRPAGFSSLFGLVAERNDGVCRARVETGANGVRTVFVTVELPKPDASRTDSVAITVTDANGAAYETRAVVARGRGVAPLKLPADAVLPISVTVRWEGSGDTHGSLVVHGVR